MAKLPVAGRVKTRLGREIGMVRAAWWMRHQLTRRVRDLTDPRWDTLLAVDPLPALASPALPAIPRLPQGRGDLGGRMARLLAGQGPVVLIGGDIPGVTKNHIQRAFRALGTSDFTLGPATDGGFWMAGHANRRPLPPRLFQSVRWSTEHALSDSMATLGDRTVSLTDTLADIDTAADLARFPATAPARHVRPVP